MFLLILVSLFAIIVVWTWWAGFWTNLLLFVNMLMGGLFASAFFLNVSRLVLNADPSFSNLTPFLAFWGLFFVAVGVMRGCTDAFSHYRLKFDNITEMFGRSCMSLMNGFLFCTLVAFSLHMAPLPRFYFPDESDSTAGIEKPWNYALAYFSGYSLSESVFYCISDPASYWEEYGNLDEAEGNYSIILAIHELQDDVTIRDQFTRSWNTDELYSRLNFRSVLEETPTLRLPSD